MRVSWAAIALGLAASWAISVRANDAANDLLGSISIKTTSGPIDGRPTDLASARAAILAGNYTSRARHQGRDTCPSGCSTVGTNTSAWYVYGNLNRLNRACNQTVILDFSLANLVDSPKSNTAISACTADLEPLSAINTGSSDSSTSPAACVVEGVQQTQVTSGLDLAASGSSSSAHAGDLINALDQLASFFALPDTSCNETIKYAYSGSVAVGVYSEAGLSGQGVASSVLAKLRDQINSDGSVAESLLVQMCNEPSARYSLGIIASTNADIGSVQRTLQSWQNNSCIALDMTITNWQNITYQAPSLLYSNATVTNTTASNSTLLAARSQWHQHDPKSLLNRDDACSTVQVIAGDSCASLAAECGITATEFTEYNPSSTLCSTLTPGQHVCCSAGTLPDFSPKPDSDGYCYAYLVQSGDSCSSIAAAYDITVDDIGTFNTHTWGWNGCASLFASYYICLSSGYPPMPATVANAVCGPQVNDTAKAPPGTDLSTLNQCPLNACCDIWGQCGTTSDFCTPSESSTGAPGTAAPNENGCISNCGTDIIVSDAPSETYNIGYFEGFDWARPCLRMSATDFDTTAYTHIHFAFITINADFTINTDLVASQLPYLIGMSGVKRVVSIGGWDFSTGPNTYTIFRDAVSSEANRQTLITNVINFMNEYGLDGVDWDWEYPDEPDIPGIPAGTADDVIGYFLLLDELKQQMPGGKTVSITAPASFWYLQYFPIQALSLVVDYIVYMTYDLHGQWDYANKYADPGCVSYNEGLSNCLRSHINLTETINSLSMITKAGVPSNMVAVGVSSYGRSFQMTTPGCWTEQCTYTGPDSGAYAGPCTDTAGYISNYEISQILTENPSAQSFWDETSYSNIIVFNDTQWVGYMNDSNKATRQALYPALSFLGTADWAVDLQSEDGDGGDSGSDGDTSTSTIYIDPGIWNSATPAVTAPPGATLIWPPMPLSTTTTITFDPWTTTVTYSSPTEYTTTLTDGSTSTYGGHVWVSWLTVLTIPPVTTTAIPVWGVSLDASSTEGTIILTSSVEPPPFKVTVTPVISGTTSIIGATTTSTSSGGGVIIWGIETYSPPAATETLGGTTTVIGGVTLPPAVITVTPNPHPTTTPNPGTIDPVINPKPPSWTSGKNPGPTALPGCPGCGFPCIFFCDPGCPFCPPNIFGSSSGEGDGNPDDPNDPSDPSNPDNPDDPDDPDDEDLVYSAVFNTVDDDDFFPATLEDAAVLSALSSELMSEISSLLGLTTSTPTTTAVAPPTTTTPTPTPTPTAECYFWDSALYYTFEVFNIEGWVTDGGSSLHTQEDGCGALTGWDWVDATSDSDELVWFDLPFFIKAGCVERAIVSAGGPKISCQGQGIGPDRRRSLDDGGNSSNIDTKDDDASRAAVQERHPNLALSKLWRRKTKTIGSFPSYTPEQLDELDKFYSALTPPGTTHQSYVPMDWSTVSSETAAATTDAPMLRWMKI